jgi:hypothetical protein
MATAYTPILKLALPVTGELQGLWGDVVNDNITSMIEQAVAGLATINTWTANSHTLTTANGTTSEARCAMLVIDDDGGGNPSAAAEVICPTATKAYIVQNISGQTVTVKTSAGTGVAILNNQAALVFCDGTNVVTGAFNGDVVGPASATDNAIVRYDGTTGKLIQSSGVTIDDSNNVSGVVQLNATTVDTTNIEVTSLKAKDGTAAGSIADATGVVTIASAVLTTADINGGTADGVTIGATTAAAVTATQVDITAQGDLRLQDTTGGQYVALQAPGTVASSYTLTLPVDDGTSGQALITDGSGVLSWSSAASGDVYGPASATDNAVARYDGTTGKIIQNSAVTIDDDGNTVISVNSATNALRITQVGTGNALLVEDSANPDSTPFVVDGGGQVIAGHTVPITTSQWFGTTYFTPRSQVLGSANGASLGVFSFSSSSSSTAQFTIGKSASNTIGQNTVVVSGENLGEFNWQGADGSNFITAAKISGQVDGTPGTNDMPGRLVFATTADGASSPTERMRIDSAGRVGIGGTPTGGTSFLSAKVLTGAADTIAFSANGQIQSDATSSATYFRAQAGTAAAAFTLPFLVQFSANQGTFGATSTVTSQYGFRVESNLIGATNNFGFHSNIASGTGRWNFYAAGSAANYFAGNVGIGTTTMGGVLSLATGSTTDIVAALGGTFPAFTYRNGTGAWFHAGKHPTNDYFYIGNGGTPTTNVSLIVDSAGRVGIGATPNAFGSFFVDRTVSGETSGSSVYVQSVCGSGVTSNFAGVTSRVTTNAAAFTISSVSLFSADPLAKGAGSTITNQYGFNAQSTITAGTNNYGFFSNIASGTGRWNFYAAGSAANYFAGQTFVGNAGAITIAGSSGQGLQIAGAAAGQLAVMRFSNDNNPNRISLGKSRNATVGSHTVLQSGDIAGEVGFWGSDGTQFLAAAQIIAYVDGTPGTNDMPGRLDFLTTSDGASGPTERLRIKSGGQVRYIPLAADPSGAEAGDVYYNSVSNKLKVYTGAGWETITSA